MLLAKLQPYVFQLEFLYLAASCHGELFYKENIFGNLVTGNLADAEVAHIRFVQVCPLVSDNECADRFTVLLGRDAGYLHILDAFQLIEKLFDFARIDIFGSAEISGW